MKTIKIVTEEKLYTFNELSAGAQARAEADHLEYEIESGSRDDSFLFLVEEYVQNAFDGALKIEDIESGINVEFNLKIDGTSTYDDREYWNVVIAGKLKALPFIQQHKEELKGRAYDKYDEVLEPLTEDQIERLINIFKECGDEYILKIHRNGSGIYSSQYFENLNLRKIDEEGEDLREAVYNLAERIESFYDGVIEAIKEMREGYFEGLTDDDYEMLEQYYYLSNGKQYGFIDEIDLESSSLTSLLDD